MVGEREKCGRVDERRRCGVVSERRNVRLLELYKMVDRKSG